MKIMSKKNVEENVRETIYKVLEKQVFSYVKVDDSIKDNEQQRLICDVAVQLVLQDVKKGERVVKRYYESKQSEEEFQSIQKLIPGDKVKHYYKELANYCVGMRRFSVSERFEILQEQ